MKTVGPRPCPFCSKTINAKDVICQSCNKHIPASYSQPRLQRHLTLDAKSGVLICITLVAIVVLISMWSQVLPWLVLWLLIYLLGISIYLFPTFVERLDNKAICMIPCPFCTKAINAKTPICQSCNKQIPTSYSSLQGRAGLLFNLKKGQCRNLAIQVSVLIGVLYMFSIRQVDTPKANPSASSSSEAESKDSHLPSHVTYNATRVKLAREAAWDSIFAMKKGNWRQAIEKADMAVIHAKESGDPVLLFEVMKYRAKLASEFGQ